MKYAIHLSKFKSEEALLPNRLDDDIVTLFENTLEEYLGKDKKVVALNSGTSAIHLALILAGVQQDDLVICQSFTFVATANPITYLGAVPVFIDSELDTWSMCPILLKTAIEDLMLKGKKPKAIVCNHAYGMPAKISELVAIAEQYDIQLIEDAASSLGATCKNQFCGTFGDYGIISFNNNKILTTLGGGILICKSKEAKEKALFLATQAKDKERYYSHSKLGYNYKMSRLNAAFGVEQLKDIQQYLSRRKAIHQWYNSFFENIQGVTVFKEFKKESRSNYWLSTILINSSEAGFSNQDLFLQLQKDGIESRFLWKPLHLQPLYQQSVSYTNGVSERLFQQGVCLPSSAHLTQNDFQRIVRSIHKIL